MAKSLPKTPISETELTEVDILQWRSSVKRMAAAKDFELELRLPICEKALKNIIGKTKIVIDSEIFIVTVSRGVNVDVDEAILNQLADDDELTAEDLACFSWKLKLSDTIHKIPKTSNVWKALSIKPARPTLSVEEKEQDGDSDD